MFLLNFVLACSVLSYINSASIAQHEDGYQALTEQRNLRKETHTITDLATSFWSELPLKFQISKGWERSKQFAEMLANKTLQVFDSLTLPTVKKNNDTIPAASQNSSSKTALNQTEATVVNLTITQHSETKINNSTINPVKISEVSSPANVINNEDDKCEESPDLSCLNWKILKVVGSALGAGFVLGLFSPVLFYFAIITVGGIGYGIVYRNVLPT